MMPPWPPPPPLRPKLGPREYRLASNRSGKASRDTRALSRLPVDRAATLVPGNRGAPTSTRRTCRCTRPSSKPRHCPVTTRTAQTDWSATSKSARDNHKDQFMPLLGRVLLLQPNLKSKKPVVRYETVEETRAALIARRIDPDVLEKAMMPPWPPPPPLRPKSPQDKPDTWLLRSMPISPTSPSVRSTPACS